MRTGASFTVSPEDGPSHGGTSDGLGANAIMRETGVGSHVQENATENF